MPTFPKRLPDGNRLLAALPREEYERLLPNLNTARLDQGEVLYEAGDTVTHAYFPLSGMCSLLSVTEKGATIEVAMVGNEGVVGIPAILRVSRSPYRIMVQVAGRAVRIRANKLREEFDRGGTIQDLLLRYTHAVLTQVSQSAVCGHFHTVEKRLCRWLLVTRDRINSDTFHLTQEFISHMLGTPRTGVTTAANSLQDAGLIRYKRAKITIIDPMGLEEASCECYKIVRKEIDQYLAA